jgi:lambda family phage portal protein
MVAAITGKTFDRTVRGRIYQGVTSLVGGVLGVFAPRAAARYMAGRENLLNVKRRGYDAAQLRGPNAKWHPMNRTGDAEIRWEGLWIRARARDLLRNDARIKGAINITMTNNVVGTGIWPMPTVAKAKDGEPHADCNKALAQAWNSWATIADDTGYGSIYAMQKLAFQHVVMDGEFLIRTIWDRNNPVLPMRVKLLEVDHLVECLDGMLENGNMIRRGIEFTPQGRVEAYHLLSHHPGDYGWTTMAAPVGQIVRVPATECKLVFNRERISQTRGVSWLSPVTMRAFDLNEYDSYEMIGAKLAAAFGVFIKTPYAEGMNASLGSPIPGMYPRGGDPDGQSPQNGHPPLDYIEPGRIQRLGAGEEIQIAEHDRPGSNYEAFVRNNKRDTAAGIGMSYETFSKDYAGATFSSARQAILEERRGYTILQDFLNEQLHDWIYSQFVRACFISGAVAMPGYGSDPARFESKTWNCPGWSWIDPQKDANASQIKIALGISSRTREARAQGVDFEECVAEQLREQELMAKLKPVQIVKPGAGTPAAQSPGQDSSGDDEGNSKENADADAA